MLVSQTDVPGSIPGLRMFFFCIAVLKKNKKKNQRQGRDSNPRVRRHCLSRATD